ncbi:MAG: hypothetical protein ACRDZY_22575, partial [Acidimicrobiales bacterium]
LESVVGQRNTQMDQLIKGDPTLSFKLSHPSPQHDADPMVIRYKAIEGNRNRAQNLQAKVNLGGGLSPEDMAALNVEDPSAPQAPNPTSVKAPPIVRSDVVAGAITRIKKDPSLLNTLDQGVSSGNLTQAEADAIRARFPAGGKSKGNVKL